MALLILFSGVGVDVVVVPCLGYESVPPRQRDSERCWVF
jgi:hypothetical protein